MTYYAHSTETENKADWQTLEQHLLGVAEKMASFSEQFATEEVACTIALLHDAGKYQKSFQKRLEGSKNKVEHSICGAQIWKDLGLPDAGAYCIAGHHSGLPNIGTVVDSCESSTLFGRLKRKTEDISVFSEEISLPTIRSVPWKQAIQKHSPFERKEYAFWIRMMFSCLVDADFLDTEEFYGETRSNPPENSLAEAHDLFFAMLETLKQDTTLKQTRSALQQQALSHAEENAQVYLLNMPTGSGKTYVSTAFALKRALLQDKKRIIYVIPYQSITQQVAGQLKKILGEEMVLEHHSSFQYESRDESGELSEKWKKASENWDYPIIVTTTAQFFESIYGNKTSKVRKIHNISNSILIFDEIHLLPRLFLQPCLEAIQILTQRYHCEALFLSATLPDFTQWMGEFQGKNWNVKDILPDKTLFPLFDTCSFATMHGISQDKFLEVLSKQHKTLVVVNYKKTARLLYQQIQGKKFHLSTDMTPEHRKETIENIKIALGKEEKITVISTSLIEAGVDLDFDTAFRELDGLDNLLQAAGRCNREGKKSDCMTYSFSLLEEEEKDKVKQIRQNLTKKVFEKAESGEFHSVSSPEAIEYYFTEYFRKREADFLSHDFAHYIEASSIHPRDIGFRFADYAKDFQLIPNNTTNVVVFREKNKEKLETLREEFQFSKGRGRFFHRQFQEHSVALREHMFRLLYEQGVFSQTNGVYFLENPHFYSEEIGILMEDTQPEHYIY